MYICSSLYGVLQSIMTMTWANNVVWMYVSFVSVWVWCLCGGVKIYRVIGAIGDSLTAGLFSLGSTRALHSQEVSTFSLH